MNSILEDLKWVKEWLVKAIRRIKELVATMFRRKNAKGVRAIGGVKELGESDLILIFIILALIAIFILPAVFSLFGTKPGDTKTLNQQTNVYVSYMPGNIGEVICKLPEGAKVTIRDILTSNELPGNTEDGMFTTVLAYFIETEGCSGWILPQNIR